MTDLEFMSDPDLWPLWPMLPLMRGTEYGVLVETYTGFEFHQGSAYDLATYKTIEGSLVGKDDMLVELINNGWLVD